MTTGSDVTLAEIARAAEVIKSTADPTAEVIWGHVIDDEVGDAIRLTLIATGFPESKAKPAPVVEKSRKEVPSPSVRTIFSFAVSLSSPLGGFLWDSVLPIH